MTFASSPCIDTDQVGAGTNRTILAVGFVGFCLPIHRSGSRPAPAARPRSRLALGDFPWRPRAGSPAGRSPPGSDAGRTSPMPVELARVARTQDDFAPSRRPPSRLDARRFDEPPQDRPDGRDVRLGHPRLVRAVRTRDTMTLVARRAIGAVGWSGSRVQNCGAPIRHHRCEEAWCAREPVSSSNTFASITPLAADSRRSKR